MRSPYPYLFYVFIISQNSSTCSPPAFLVFFCNSATFETLYRTSLHVSLLNMSFQFFSYFFIFYFYLLLFVLRSDQFFVCNFCFPICAVIYIYIFFATALWTTSIGERKKKNLCCVQENCENYAERGGVVAGLRRGRKKNDSEKEIVKKKERMNKKAQKW